MMNLIVEKNINLEKWNKLLLCSPYSNPFQTPDFYHYINSVSCYKALVLALEVQSEYKILAVVTLQKEKGIKGYFSRRAIIYGGLLISSESNNQVLQFIHQLQLFLKKQAIYIEIRNSFNYFKYSDIFKEKKWKYLPYVNYQLQTYDKTPDEILKIMPYNRRREIKMTLKEGVQYYQTFDLDEINDIYKILFELYQSRVQKPLPSLSFFQQLINNKQSTIFAVKHENKIIGGSFCLFFPNKGIYTWYYCGLRNYHNKIFSTHIAVWAVINHAIENNLLFVDFMGAGLAHENYGVREYKAKFGGELVEHGRFLKILNPVMFGIGKLGLKAINILKLQKA